MAGASHSSFPLDKSDVFKIVNHSVGSIVHECGYHLAQESCIDILTEVCTDYIGKITNLLKITEETQDCRDEQTDFVDSLERVFHKMNVSSAANVHQFITQLDLIKKHQLEQDQAEAQMQRQQQQHSEQHQQHEDTQQQ